MLGCSAVGPRYVTVWVGAVSVMGFGRVDARTGIVVSYIYFVYTLQQPAIITDGLLNTKITACVLPSGPTVHSFCYVFYSYNY